MAYGDGPADVALMDAWNSFCDQLKQAGRTVFKESTPADPMQRVDAFRFLTQNLGQAFDLALETRNPDYPLIHAFCGPTRKLGGDNADFTYHQAWIKGGRAYRITGHKGTARFFNIAVQGIRPSHDVYSGAGIRPLHEPFGDTPEANIFGHELVTDWNGNFELYIGGEKRGPNWLPTTAESRKLFIRQGFDRWDEESAQIRIERLDMDGPRPLPDVGEMTEAMAWSGNFLVGMMQDWPEHPMLSRGSIDPDLINAFIGSQDMDGAVETQDERRGRLLVTMPWRLAPDEAMIIEFEGNDAFWMFTNMGPFWNSMDYLYRPVSFSPSRAHVDADGRVRLVMAHDDLGHHNWLATQGFGEGYLCHRAVLSRKALPISTRVLKAAELAGNLPEDTRMVNSAERRGQMQLRFDGIRRRYRL